jgi:hypothetical protein
MDAPDKKGFACVIPRRLGIGRASVYKGLRADA